MKKVFELLKKEKATIIQAVIYSICLYLVLTCVVSPARIISGSMEPTIATKDFVLYNQLAYFKNIPSHGDIVLFNKDNEKWCKRIIGIEGDEISFSHGSVYRNGEKIEETYLPKDIKTYSLKTFIVPEGKVFLLGDNRMNSHDSRFWDNPYIDTEDVEGKVLFVIPLHRLMR